MFPTGRKNSGDTRSKSSLHWVKQCIERCLNNHSRCHRTFKRIMPTRVLDVGLNDGKIIKLSDSILRDDRYVCLSHCWGNSRALLTTKENLQLHRDGIHFDMFPRTFQDAITFCRSLGVRYIWIDSLCIIQNDALDWERESGIMASIYENSYVTVSATHSPNSHTGCFSSRPFFSSTDSSNGQRHHIYARPQIVHPNNTVWKFHTLPLMNRGWVYQERILSPRVIHFGHQELAWECREVADCECSEFSERLHVQLKELIYTTKKPDHQAVSSAWRRAVQEYTILDLTLPSDRLPALSGLAQAVLRLNPSDEYLAGLWRHSLSIDLLWFVSPQGNTTPMRPSGYAPSWSWVSVSCPVKFVDIFEGDREWELIESYFQLVDARCTSIGTNTTGEVASGQLVVSGTTVPVSIEWNTTARGSTVHIRGIPFTYVDHSDLEIDSRSNFFRVDLRKEDFQKLLQDVENKIYCLRVSRCKTVFGEREYGLALRCIDLDHQVYERIGLMAEMRMFSSSVDYKDATDVWGSSPCAFAIPNAQRTITII